MIHIVDELVKRKIRFTAIKENIHFEGKQDLQTKVMVALFGLFAEVERDLISERTREGLASARAKGRLLGRPKGSLGKSRLDGKEEEIRILLQKQVSKASIAKIVGVTRPTIHRFIETRSLAQESAKGTIRQKPHAAPPPAKITHKSALTKGFTLIEMSMVLVIIGLIVGGVLVGQSLIQAAQMRSLMQQVERYKTAAMTFRDKYNALPGDIANATTFWPADPACGAGGSRPSMTTPNGMTCNGNGNGIIEAHGSTYGAESLLFWQHLNLAGLIQDGPFTGSYDNSGWGLVNAPTSRFNSGSSFFQMVNPDIAYPPASYPNWFWPQGGQHVFWLNNATGVDGNGNPIWTGYGSNASKPLTSAQAFALDTKYDDGNPSTGTITNGPPDGNGNTTTQEVCMDGSVTPPQYWNSGHPGPGGGIGGLPLACDLMFKAGF